MYNVATMLSPVIVNARCCFRILNIANVVRSLAVACVAFVSVRATARHFGENKPEKENGMANTPKYKV